MSLRQLHHPAAATGQAFSEIKLEPLKNLGATKVLMNRVKLVGARVANDQTSEQEGRGDLPTDSISFRFDAIS